LFRAVIITPRARHEGGLKEISQNPDNGSKNSENQKKDGVRPKIAQNYQIV